MVDITYKCIYIDGSTRTYDKLPDPPEGFHWRFESLAYCVKTYSLMGPPVRVTFKTDRESKTYLSSKIPHPERLPRIPKHKGYIGYWDVPKRIHEPITIEPVYVPESELRQYISGRRMTHNGDADFFSSPHRCPRCGSKLRLYDNSLTGGTFTGCTRHGCTFTAGPKYFFEGE